MSLKPYPMTIRKARLFIRARHRHHKMPAGGLFAVGVASADELVGVAIVGRPVARRLDDGETLELTRLCTDGTRNACSFLLGRVVRVALPEEGGASLRASGWNQRGLTRGGVWTRESRKRADDHTGPKARWSLELSAGGES